jgi:hypothetical protein
VLTPWTPLSCRSSSSPSPSFSVSASGPYPYPVLGNFVPLIRNFHRLLAAAPASTIEVRGALGLDNGPGVVDHFLRANFPNYVKGRHECYCNFPFSSISFICKGTYCLFSDRHGTYCAILDVEYHLSSSRRALVGPFLDLSVLLHLVPMHDARNHQVYSNIQ